MRDMTFTKWYFGMDTNSSPPFPCAGSGKNFYIGRIGHGDTPDLSDFDSTTATAVGPTVTSSYWDIEGPGTAPSGFTPTQWGQLQADSFINARNSNSQVGGQTLFGDLEQGNLGWNTFSHAQAQDIVHSFLEVINNNGFIPGLYTSTGAWDYFLTSSYHPLVPFVFWLTGTDCPTSCAAAESEFNSTYTNITRGGYRTMIWQYVIAQNPQGGGCTNETKDLDITPYSGYLTGHWNPTT
jgi:hypothetical protein